MAEGVGVTEQRKGAPRGAEDAAIVVALTGLMMLGLFLVGMPRRVWRMGAWAVRWADLVVPVAVAVLVAWLSAPLLGSWALVPGWPAAPLPVVVTVLLLAGALLWWVRCPWPWAARAAVRKAEGRERRREGRAWAVAALACELPGTKLTRVRRTGLAGNIAGVIETPANVLPETLEKAEVKLREHYPPHSKHGRARALYVNPSGDGSTVRLRVVRRLAYTGQSGAIPWQPGLPVALQDTGEDWRLKLPGERIMCVGASGAGKSGWQNVIIGSSFGLPYPVVRWGVDIKQVELGLWAGAFERVALDLASASRLLADVDVEIRRRFGYLAARGERLWSPGCGLPLLLVVVDEMRELIRVAPGERPDAGKERQSRLESAAALARASGVVLLCCTQEPLAETVGRIRVNMSTTICGRVRTEVDAVTALGNVGRFLQPERITVPGEAWVVPTGEPFKARARWVSDEGIRWLARA